MKVRECSGGSGYFDHLMNQAGFDGLNGHPHAFDGAVGQFNADALHVRLKTTFRRLGHVSANTAAFFGDTFTVNDAPGGRAFSSDGTDSRHGVSFVKRTRNKSLDVVGARGNFRNRLAKR